MTVIKWEHGERFDHRPVVFQSVVGSHNYNLNVPTSDTDWKVYVAPSFTDLFESKHFQATTIGEEEDREVHDIRKLMSHLKKSNINFVETLFSSNFIGNSEFYDEVVALVDMRHDIARMNLQYFYKANVGMYIEKMKKWEKTYNFKELMTAFRVLDFLVMFAGNDFTDMSEALKYDGKEREIMLGIRAGDYEEEAVKKIIGEMKYEVDLLEDLYMSQSVNEETYQQLYDVIQSIVSKQMKKELN